MNTQKTARLFALLSGMMTLSMTAAHAATVPAPAKAAPAKAAVSPQAVTVKIGEAMLEEYHGGDPSKRTTILRGGDVAQKAKTGDGGKKRS